VPVNTGVVDMILGRRSHETLFSQESIVNFAVSPTHVPTQILVPLSNICEATSPFPHVQNFET
jgi:hypothetical protein